MSTTLQIQANKRNAQRSTGPKSTTLSRFNALKHGLLARDVVITLGHGKESQREFRMLLATLRSDLEPSNTLEELLLEKLAVAYWRLRRAVKAEKGVVMHLQDGSEAQRNYSAIEQAPAEANAAGLKKEIQLAVQTNSRAIPSADFIDRQLRYETAMERQFYRALNQFIRIKFGFVSQKASDKGLARTTKYLS